MTALHSVAGKLVRKQSVLPLLRGLPCKITIFFTAHYPPIISAICWAGISICFYDFMQILRDRQMLRKDLLTLFESHTIRGFAAVHYQCSKIIYMGTHTFINIVLLSIVKGKIFLDRNLLRTAGVQ